MILKKYFKLICLIILIASNLLIFLIINTSPFFSNNNYVCEKQIFFKTPFQSLTGNVTERIIDEAIFRSDGSATISRIANNSLKIKANKKMSSCNESLNILKSLVESETDLILQSLDLKISQRKSMLELRPEDTNLQDLRDRSTFDILKSGNVKLISILVKDTQDGQLDNTFYTKILFLVMNIFVFMFLYALSFLLRNQSFLKFFIKR